MTEEVENSHSYATLAGESSLCLTEEDARGPIIEDRRMRKQEQRSHQNMTGTLRRFQFLQTSPVREAGRGVHSGEKIAMDNGTLREID